MQRHWMRGEGRRASNRHHHSSFFFFSRLRRLNRDMDTPLPYFVVTPHATMLLVLDEMLFFLLFRFFVDAMKSHNMPRSRQTLPHIYCHISIDYFSSSCHCRRLSSLFFIERRRRRRCHAMPPPLIDAITATPCFVFCRFSRFSCRRRLRIDAAPCFFSFSPFTLFSDAVALLPDENATRPIY